MKEQTKVAKVIMLGKKKFVKLEEDKHDEFVATIKQEDVEKTSLKDATMLMRKEDDGLVSKSETEKVKDELVVGVQSGLGKHDEIVIGTTLSPLNEKEVIGQSNIVSTEVCKSYST